MSRAAHTFDGKRIAVVGNANSLLETQYGAEIDGYDLVLRMNRGLPVNYEAQGRRTDVLAIANLFETRDVYRKFGAANLLWMSPTGREDGDDSFWFYDIERWEALRSRLGSRPSVGAMVLDALSAMNPASVTVYGFDFKETGTFYQASQHIGPHDYAAEREWCLDLLNDRGWTRRTA